MPTISRKAYSLVVVCSWQLKPVITSLRLKKILIKRIWKLVLPSITRSGRNMPFPSSKKSHFQSEAKCVAIDMKMIFNYDANKTHFHNKGFALSLVLKAKFLELGNGLLHLSNPWFKSDPGLPHGWKKTRNHGHEIPDSCATLTTIHSNMAPVAEPKKEKETSDKKEDTKSKDGTKKEEEPELVSTFH